MKYRIAISEEALWPILACRGLRQRSKLIAFLESLAGDPHRAGEYSAKDGAGRTVELTVFGRHVVTYYADHAVRELRVLDIQAAD